jgi:hypothetical protein
MDVGRMQESKAGHLSTLGQKRRTVQRGERKGEA